MAAKRTINFQINNLAPFSSGILTLTKFLLKHEYNNGKKEKSHYHNATIASKIDNFYRYTPEEQYDKHE